MGPGFLLKKYPGVYLYILLFIVVFAWGIALQIFPLKDTYWNYMFNVANGLLYLAGGVVGYIYGRCKMGNSNLIRAVIFLVFSQFVWAIASFVWAYYNTVLGVSVPFPSYADLFYVLNVVLIGIACWFFLELSEAQITQRNITESILIVFFSYSMVFLLFQQLPLSTELTYIDALSHFLYPMIDTIIFSLAFVTYRIGGAKVKRSMMLILVSIFLQMSGDFLFSFTEITTTYWNGSISDILYTLSGFVMTFAIISFGSCPFTGKDPRN